MTATRTESTGRLPALYGLVLAGGASRRMQRDKASLEYHGRPQLECAFELLSPHCERTFVSVRPDQVAEPVRARFPQVVDTLLDKGPIAGLAAAQAAHPDVAWLVLACDLPFVSPETLIRLVAARALGTPATAYRSAHDGLPEPLCAIYEPATRNAVLDAIAAGKVCPRKLLVRLDAPLLELPEPDVLDNVNTPDELAAARSALLGQTAERPQ
jgi:molybdopterin-guanine dinucleotide biosynthesis protein A